ncbi:MAG: hypothetical protein LIP03_10380 [Bacteroidales bacterium]|nr:hypothetical protein [Bacteroidales bacterium]
MEKIQAPDKKAQEASCEAAATEMLVKAKNGETIELKTGLSASYVRHLIKSFEITKLHVECSENPGEWYIVPFLGEATARHDQPFCLSELNNLFFGSVSGFKDYKLQMLFLLHANPRWGNDPGSPMRGELVFFSNEVQERVRKEVYSIFGPPDAQKKLSPSVGDGNASYWFDHNLPFLRKVYRITPEFEELSGIKKHLAGFDIAKHEAYLLWEQTLFAADREPNWRPTVKVYAVVLNNYIYIVPIADNMSMYAFEFEDGRKDDCLFFLLRYFTCGLRNKRTLLPKADALRGIGIKSYRKVKKVPFGPVYKTLYRVLM